MGADNETKTTPGTQAFRLLRVRQPRTVALQSWRRVNPRLIIIPQMGELLWRFTLIADKNVRAPGSEANYYPAVVSPPNNVSTSPVTRIGFGSELDISRSDLFGLRGAFSSVCRHRTRRLLSAACLQD